MGSTFKGLSQLCLVLLYFMAYSSWLELLQGWRLHIFNSPLLLFPTLLSTTPAHSTPLLSDCAVVLTHCCWMQMITSVAPEASRRTRPLVLYSCWYIMYILHILKYGHESSTVYVCLKEWINSLSFYAISVYTGLVLLYSRTLWYVCRMDTLLLWRVA